MSKNRVSILELIKSKVRGGEQANSKTLLPKSLIKVVAEQNMST